MFFLASVDPFLAPQGPANPFLGLLCLLCLPAAILAMIWLILLTSGLKQEQPEKYKGLCQALMFPTGVLVICFLIVYFFARIAAG